MPSQTKEFNHDEIVRIMQENGFTIQKKEEQHIQYSPEALLEVCLIGGYMQIFQKAIIDLPDQEYNQLLSDAINHAQAHARTNESPVIETIIYYTAKKE